MYANRLFSLSLFMFLGACGASDAASPSPAQPSPRSTVTSTTSSAGTEAAAESPQAPAAMAQPAARDMPLAVGDAAPGGWVRGDGDAPMNVASTWSGGTGLVMFYRGHW